MGRRRGSKKASISASSSSAHHSLATKAAAAAAAADKAVAKAARAVAAETQKLHKSILKDVVHLAGQSQETYPVVLTSTSREAWDRASTSCRMGPAPDDLIELGQSALPLVFSAVYIEAVDEYQTAMEPGVEAILRQVICSPPVLSLLVGQMRYGDYKVKFYGRQCAKMFYLLLGILWTDQSEVVHAEQMNIMYALFVGLIHEGLRSYDLYLARSGKPCAELAKPSAQLAKPIANGAGSRIRDWDIESDDGFDSEEEDEDEDNWMNPI
ncbi:hypothetical protein FB45DRAFT_945611 [Roridomyces roridus]|uniref:Uncharacterized protein n=1 Tax=Roridomyces roridus TaxID=1738132 RepID=A0AAD7B3I2_9AGAR|nr:hypothetical protein FB45DRAFT_945611 [Roridomyces roridus]